MFNLNINLKKSYMLLFLKLYSFPINRIILKSYELPYFYIILN